MNQSPENPLIQPDSSHMSANRMVRGLAIMLVIVVLLAVAISACGTSSATQTGKTAAATTAAGTWSTTTAPAYDKGGVAPNSSMPPILPTATTTPSSGTRPSDVAVKIIRNASMELEAADVDKAYQDLLGFASARGGYEASRRQSTNENNVFIEARIKIAPQYLDEFLSHAGNTARVINVQTTSQDVTESYYDVQTRLKTMEQMLAKYTDFLSRAATVNEALSVQSEINRLTTEIESLKGRLRYYDSMVAESTVTLVIRKIPERVQTTREVRWNALTLDDMWYLMRSGLVTVANTLTNIFQWLIIAIVALSPLLIIALIAWLIARKRRGPRPPRGSRRNRSDSGTPLDAAQQPDMIEHRAAAGKPGVNRFTGWHRKDEPVSPRPRIPDNEPLIPPQPDEPVVPTHPGEPAGLDESVPPMSLPDEPVVPNQPDEPASEPDRKP